jgi:mono/diheme cytochrome c family protein
MWISPPASHRSRWMPWTMRAAFLVPLMMLGCSEAVAPDLESDAVAPTAVAGTPAAPPPATVADLFPEGPGRSLVLDNCGACHAVACTTIGRRTLARWNSLRDDHRDKVPGLRETDLGTLFAYLSGNFSDNQPEPTVPPHLLEGGCTPF